MARDWVVDVFVPVAVAVHADDAEMAESMALDLLDEQGVRARIEVLVNADTDTDFVISDSPAKAEAGEA